MNLTHHDPPLLSDRAGVTMAEDDDYFYDLVPMLFNHRLVLTPKTNTTIWNWGWCYPSAIAAIAAMRIWNPHTQNEPLGWHKRPTLDDIRTAPAADEEPHHNRRRCEHGTYPDTTCHHIGCKPTPTNPWEPMGPFTHWENQ